MLKHIEKEIRTFKNKTIKEIVSSVKTTEDKIQAIELICNESIFSWNGWLEIPSKLKNYYKYCCDYTRYSVLLYNEFLEQILDYIEDDETSYGLQYDIDNDDWVLEESWRGLNKEQLEDKVVDYLFNYMIENKISGCVIDW